MNHGPMLGCFDPRCPQCYKAKPVSSEVVTRIARQLLTLPKEPADTQSLYVRYHEIGNRPEKPKPPKSFIAWDLAGDNFTQVTMDEITKAFTVTPAELGVVEKSNYSKETNDMSPFTFSIDLGNISSQSSSSSTPEQRLLSAVSDLAKDNPDLAKKLKETAEKAEREHKEGIEEALKGVNYLAMKEGHCGRDFCVSFWCNGEAQSLDGTDYAYGEDISEDDISNENRVFVSGSVWPVSGTYATMDRLKQRLERSEILYVIEYYPDQD